MSAFPAPQDIVDFWLTEVGPKGWYAPTAALDQTCADRFGALWDEARRADIAPFVKTPQDTLASLILLDQMPRNMHRNRAEAFATDTLALRTAHMATKRHDDDSIDGDAKMFFFMPFIHSELIGEQDAGIALLSARMPGSGTLRHARAHREIIRRFNRFPFRNAALGRTTTPAEQEFMDAGGYGAVLREIPE